MGVAGNKRLIVALLASVSISLMGLGVVVPLMPVFATDLGASGLWLGIMLAAFSISRGVLQPFVGVYSDRYGRKRFIVAGLAIYAAISFVYILAQSPYDLTIMRFVHGAGSAMVIPVITASLGDITPPNKEGQYMAFMNISIFGGLAAGPLIGGLLQDNVGISSAFVVMGGLSALALIVIIWLLPSGKGVLPSEEIATLGHLANTLRSTRVRGILSYRLFTAIIFGPTYAFLPLFMNDNLNSSGSAVGLVITVRILVTASLQLPFGYLADRMDRVALATVGGLGVGVLVLFIPFADSLSMLIVIIAVMGAFEGLAWTSIQALSVEEGRYHGQGSVQGLSHMSLSGGLLIGSFFGGLLMDVSGIASTFIVTGIVVSSGSLFSAAILVRNKKQELPRCAGIPRAEEAVPSGGNQGVR